LFTTLEDETGLVNVIVQPKIYHAQAQTLRGQPLLIIDGILEREGGTMDVIARRAWPFTTGCLQHSPSTANACGWTRTRRPTRR
jgi:hypothetical protein